jgi:hypothetical protein
VWVTGLSRSLVHDASGATSMAVATIEDSSREVIRDDIIVSKGT